MSKSTEEVVAAIVRANQILKAHGIAIHSLLMCESQLEAVMEEHVPVEGHYRESHRGFMLPMVCRVDVIPVSDAFWKSTYGR